MSLLQPELTPQRVRAARLLALAADVTQMVLFPIFGAGALSPFEDVLDLAVGSALVFLIGWHWSFLPTFALELVPMVDAMPTWTAAVFFATRKSRRPAELPSAPVIPPVP